ncbi:MAG: nicotinamide mononucleotide transporter [Clostridia bacterium]|nr:nicotinamide mononucleotide transporter [Clostridia bacterium]
MHLASWLVKFSRGEIILWLLSVLASAGAALLFGTDSPLSLAASIVGVTSLIFLAKGNPIGQVLMLVFSVLYGIISYQAAYYGEMLTYLGMTAPMAAAALVSWLRHPYKDDAAGARTVAVARLSRRSILMTAVLTAAATLLSWPLLAWLGTANLFFSVLSVSTSFAAVYLTYLRSAAYALGYALNDAVLIVLWALAARDNMECLSMVVCFAAFLINDLYGFVNWQRMRALQEGQM